MGGGGSGELLLLSFIGSWMGLADSGSGGGERGRDFMVESGKATGGLTGLEGAGAAGAGAGAGVNSLVIAGGRGLGGLTGLAELRAKTDSDLVLLVLVVVLILVLFEVDRGSRTVVLMGLWLLDSRGARTGGIGGETDFAGGGGSGGEGGTDFAGGGGGGDFDGLGERAGGGGGGLAGLGGVFNRCLCGLGSLDPSGLFRAIEVADPWALALTLALTVGLEGATETGPYATRAGRGGGGKFGLTAIWWGGDGSGPALGTGGIERATL